MQRELPNVDIVIRMCSIVPDQPDAVEPHFGNVLPSRLDNRHIDAFVANVLVTGIVPVRPEYDGDDIKKG